MPTACIQRLREDVSAIRSDVTSLKWMFGVTWTLLLVLLGAVLQVPAKLPGRS